MLRLLWSVSHLPKFTLCLALLGVTEVYEEAKDSGPQPTWLSWKVPWPTSLAHKAILFYVQKPREETVDLHAEVEKSTEPFIGKDSLYHF